MSKQAELKENVLANKLEATFKLLLTYRNQALAALAVLVAVVLIGSVFILRQKQLTEENWEKLAEAQYLYDTKQFGKSKELLTQVITKDPNSTVSLFSYYYMGQAGMEEKNYPEAEKNFVTLIEKSKGHPLQPLAMSSLGVAYENQNKFADAISLYRRFMSEHEGHFMAPRIQLALGRTLVKSGDLGGAKESLSQLVDLYPTSKWAENARRILDKIETR